MKKLTGLSFVALCFFGFAAESFAASAVSDKDDTTTYLVLGGVALAVLVFISVKTNTYLKSKFGYGLFQKSFIYAFFGVALFLVALFLFAGGKETQDLTGVYICALIAAGLIFMQFKINIREINFVQGTLASLLQILMLTVAIAIVLLVLLFIFGNKKQEKRN